jgi:hypothetical protein
VGFCFAIVLKIKYVHDSLTHVAEPSFRCKEEADLNKVKILDFKLCQSLWYVYINS